MPSPLGPDDATGADASRREFLAKVEAILRTLPVKVDVAFGELETAPDTAYRWGPPAGARGLIVRSPDGLPSVDGVAQVVAASVLDEGDAYEESGARLTRERSLAFEALPGGGRAVYRLYILENPWEARGHGRWSPPTRVLESEDPAEIAMGIAAWANHSAEEPVIHPPRTAVANRLHRQLEAKRVGLRDLEVVADVGPAELLEAASEPVLEHVNRRLLLWHFPRDQRGRLQARAVVLLSCLRTAASPQARELWLCAEGPANAPASQQIHLRLRWEHGANQDHRWDDAPHLWDTRCQAYTLESRWGIDNRSRADRSADHMEAGRLGEGLEVYGIELSPEANEV
ncbi:MAG: hypothetical protein J2P28_23400, partial [Actinobacteria bacterium]|nr:hypothetical protein [Actinomycetota bacterium]